MESYRYTKEESLIYPNLANCKIRIIGNSKETFDLNHPFLSQKTSTQDLLDSVKDTLRNDLLPDIPNMSVGTYVCVIYLKCNH